MNKNMLRHPAGTLRMLLAKARAQPQKEEPQLDALAGVLDGYLFGAQVRPQEVAGVGFLHVELEGCPTWIMVPEPGLAIAWRDEKEAEEEPEPVAA
jgi:hypothetical protein